MQTNFKRPEQRVFWLSTKKMTLQVVAREREDGRLVLVEAAPICKKFIGQPMANLVRWMQCQGGFMMKEIT